jgi:hypothetical protein
MSIATHELPDPTRAEKRCPAIFTMITTDVTQRNYRPLEMPYFLLFVILVSFGKLGNAADTQSDFRCRPALSYFCENIHVSCAGATNIRTTPFSVSIVEKVARVDFEESRPPKTGRVSGTRDLVIRLENSRDWIRIEKNGRYSQRIHGKRGAAMGHGICEPVTPR